MHFRRVLLNLTFLVIVFILFYFYQTLDGSWILQSLQNRNGSQIENIPTTVKIKFEDINSTSFSLKNLSITFSPTSKENYNVWCIFTRVTTNSQMKKKFEVFTESLLRLASVNITFHLISDEDSKKIADNVVKDVMSTTRKRMKVQYYDVQELAASLKDIVSVMSAHFSSKPGTYYSDALFFLSLGLHRIAPPEQKLAAMFDADTKFRKDVKELFHEFSNFGQEALFGLAYELTPVYRHVLYLYRNKNPYTLFGKPASFGGYPGYNSGMVLFNLERLRNSILYPKIISKESIANMTKKYYFKGHLGDQDFYTLLGMERPELIHTIDCGWNRQLCTWWRDRGYADVFNDYSSCDSETKLWHGNCNTPIPED